VIQLAEILTPERVLRGVQVGSKKRLLEHLGEIFSQDLPLVTSLEIFQGLLARERLGTTGFGNGVAIPHARMSQLDKTQAVFIQTSEPIPYTALDDKPVDLVFALLVPAEASQEHLDILAHLAGIFSDEEFRRRLRAAPDSLDKYHLLTEWQPHH
jgi:PTS system nitrogen regulatory IIA component